VVFKSLWKDIANNLDKYKGYPRIVGETGGKNFHLIHASADLHNAVQQSIRSAFEYQGQKCSALSRLYVPSSLWNAGFREQLIAGTKAIRMGPPEEFQNFCGPVIAKHSFDKIVRYIAKAKEAGAEILVGGNSDDSKGFFVEPTVILTADPGSVTMVEEIFGPVLTVYVYNEAEYDKTLELIDTTTAYALTGSIFSQDRTALVHATNKLRNASGNVYYNDKCTGAVVGQQPFGGGRASGTNDKAGSISIFYRFVSARSIKETFVGISGYEYPSNFREQ